MLLREHAGEVTEQLGQWWTEYQFANDSRRREMIRQLSKQADAGGGESTDGKRRRRGGRRRGPRKPSAAE